MHVTNAAKEKSSMKRWIKLSMLAMSLMLMGTSAATTAGTMVEAKRYLTEMPATFTKNLGQWPDEILFRASDRGTVYWFAKDGVYYQFTRGKSTPETSPFDAASVAEAIPAPAEYEVLMIRARFKNLNPDVHVRADRLIDYKCNYFLGDDPAKWRTDVPNYESITYENIFDGINLTFANANQQLECKLEISPGADLGQVLIVYDNVSSLLIDGDGKLQLETPWGDLETMAPPVHGSTSGDNRIRGICTRLLDSSTLGLAFYGGQDQSQAIALAPGLVFSTYLGAAGGDEGTAVRVFQDTVYVAGSTSSALFPVTSGAFDLTHNVPTDGFVSKFNPAGSALVFSTFIGGFGDETICDLLIDAIADDAILLTGYTDAGGFPRMLPYDNTHNGLEDAFATALSRDGDELFMSTYLGGTGRDYGQGLAASLRITESQGWIDVIVVGSTSSSDFPTANAFDATHNGLSDAFCTRLRWESPFWVPPSAPIYSTYIGGTQTDRGLGISQWTSVGTPCLTGTTNSSNFPTANAYDQTLADNYGDAFVCQFAVAGNGQLYPILSTYFGGANDAGSPYPDIGKSICRDTSSSPGDIVVYGSAASDGLATTGSFDEIRDKRDAFVARFNSSGNVLLACTYLGGQNDEYFSWENSYRAGNSLALDAGLVYVAGSTRSPDFPLKNAIDASLDGPEDIFVAKLDPSLATLHYGSYLGGTQQDVAQSISVGVNSSGECVYICGDTYSGNFPIVNPYDGVGGSDLDAFVAKLRIPTCGDADGNGIATISDAVYLINFIFAGGPAPNPLLNGDADCNSIVTISDAVYLINYIFAGGPAPCAAC